MNYEIISWCARVDLCTPAPVRLLAAPLPLTKSVQDSVMTIMPVSSP